MKLVIAGATGFIGTRLCASLQRDGDQITAITRDPAAAASTLGPNIAVLDWADETVWQGIVADADAVINLAGASIAGKRWTDEYKATLRRSRIQPTERLARARPRVLINASGADFYGDQEDKLLTEDAPPGYDFISRLCLEWEEAACLAEVGGARVVCLRLGPVLGRGGGALAGFLNPPHIPFSPWKLGLGGPLGNGSQWMPWIHLDDAIGLIRRALQPDVETGPLNVVTPTQITNREFSTALGTALGKPSLIPVPAFALRLLVGEFAETLLTSKRVVPARAQALGYPFQFPEIGGALADLCAGSA